MKHLITIITTLLCISLLFSCTDNSKKPSGESTPDLHFISSTDNTITYGFDSITALKNALGSTAVVHDYPTRVSGGTESDAFSGFLELAQENGKLWLLVEKENGLMLEHKDGFEAITLFSKELFGQPHIWYHCLYGGKEVTVSTMDLTPLDITVTADMNCSEILSLISKDSPNVDNYQDFESYKKVSLSTVTLSDREVSCLVFEMNDGRKPFVSFVYESLYVIVRADLTTMTPEFWRTVEFSNQNGNSGGIASGSVSIADGAK